MEDGALTLTLDQDLARRLNEAAQAAGLPVEAFAADILSEAVTLPDEDWIEDLARLEAYERTGEAVPAEPALTRFQQAVAARSNQRK